jgi:hypothetical protein
VTITIALLLVSLLLASTALARVTVQVTCRGPLPFSTAELIEAIELRLPLMRIDRRRALPAVEVEAAAADRAAITVGGSRHALSIEGLAGAAAARVVALLALDLISSQQRDSEPRAQEPEPLPAPRPSNLVFVGVSPRLTVGVSEWAASFEPTLDLGVRLTRRFFVYVESGFTWTGAGEGKRALTLVEIPVRVGVAFRYAWLEARAGAALRPYLVSGAREEYEDQGLLAGGGLSLRALRSLTSRLVGYLAVGIDILTKRKAYSVGGDPALSTSWVAPWVGLGAGWQGG